MLIHLQSDARQQAAVAVRRGPDQESQPSHGHGHQVFGDGRLTIGHEQLHIYGGSDGDRSRHRQQYGADDDQWRRAAG